MQIADADSARSSFPVSTEICRFPQRYIRFYSRRHLLLLAMKHPAFRQGFDSDQSAAGRLTILIFERGHGLQQFRGSRAIGHPIVFADFAVTKNQHAFRELGDVLLVCNKNDG